MPIERTGAVPPVTPVVASEGGNNHPGEDSARKRFDHEGIARDYAQAGRTLADMAKDPLPANVAEAIAGTKVTISEEGRHASELDAEIVDEQPATNPGARAYQKIQGMDPGVK